MGVDAIALISPLDGFRHLLQRVHLRLFTLPSKVRSEMYLRQTGYLCARQETGKSRRCHFTQGLHCLAVLLMGRMGRFCIHPVCARAAGLAYGSCAWHVGAMPCTALFSNLRAAKVLHNVHTHTHPQNAAQMPTAMKQGTAPLNNPAFHRLPSQPHPCAGLPAVDAGWGGVGCGEQATLTPPAGGTQEYARIRIRKLLA